MIVKDNYLLAIQLGKISNASEEVVGALVRLFYTQNKHLDFLKCASSLEIEDTGIFYDRREYSMALADPNVLFRANSVASKGIDSLMKLLSPQYLSKILSAIIKGIYTAKQSCEVLLSSCSFL